MKKVIIGSRGSELSLKQTAIVTKLLLDKYPDLTIDLKVVQTKGDINMKPIPLDTVGKGWFTKEIDHELINERIDIAVHSLKDLGETLPSGLMIAAVPERDNPREVLVSKHNIPLEKLLPGSVIGTDSSRRKTAVLNKRPDLIVTSIRGNINTRLQKLYTQKYDALILAAAGLKRLGLEDKITQYFSISDFVPAPGQGALAVVVKKTRKSILNLVKRINNQTVMKEVEAERAFSLEVGGGCKTPVGAYAKQIENRMIVYGMIGSTDGLYVVKESIEGDALDGIRLGKTLAHKLIQESHEWFSR